MASKTAIVPASTSTIITPEQQAFNELAELTCRSVAASSGRIYRQTFVLWETWCEQNAINPLDLRPVAVLDFLGEQSTSKATRQRQLSALRKLSQMSYLANPNDDTRRMWEMLKLIKVPDQTVTVSERTKRALSPAEADKLLRVWHDDTAQDKRNQALVAVLLLTGVRRSEAAALLWADIDFENGVLTIRHGKGDKRREVPIAGDFALAALRIWQMEQPTGYRNVFTPVKRGGSVGQDKPITGTDVYRIVKATEDISGVEFKPHDCRRTFITEALAMGAPLATVQAAAGHARGETTLHYAQAVDARRARKELKLRYG